METSKKNFRKRTAILSYMRQTHDHPSAEMVYNHLKQEIPDLSLGTVYRNLSMFKNQGEIISLEQSTEWNGSTETLNPMFILSVTAATQSQI